MDTGRATEKGDVYSYGVILLELLSGRRPSDPSLVAEGLNLVGWVKLSIKENIQFEMFDPKTSDGTPKEQLESLLQIAAMCVNPVPEERPQWIAWCNCWRPTPSSPAVVVSSPTPTNHLILSRKPEAAGQLHGG